MLKFLLLALTGLSGVFTQDKDCCKQKRLGNDVYIFAEETTETSDFNCKSDCVYEKQGEPNSRYCFKTGGNQTPTCEIAESDGTFYHTPSPFYILERKDPGDGLGGEDANYTVTGHKNGYGVTLKDCVSCEGKGCIATIFVDRIVEAVSTNVIREDAKTISKYLKQEYQEEYTKETEQKYFSGNVAWGWLGLGASVASSSSSEVENKYTNGEEGLKAARKEFSNLIGTHLKSESKIRGEAKVVSTSFIPVKGCLYFAIDNVKFADGSTLKVLSDNPNEAKTATENGKEIQNEGVNYSVEPL